MRKKLMGLALGMALIAFVGTALAGDATPGATPTVKKGKGIHKVHHTKKAKAKKKAKKALATPTAGK